MKRYNKFNSKRRLAKPDHFSEEDREALAEVVVYTGNPEHKRNPGDFGLTPPARPRRNKTLCDAVSIFQRDEALGYLKEGIRRGSISDRFVGEWPKTVWAVSDKGIPLEAQRDGEGRYHGYPMPLEDPMAAKVKKFWNGE